VTPGSLRGQVYADTGRCIMVADERLQQMAGSCYRPGKPMQALPILKRLLVSLVIVGVGFVIIVYAASEWKIRRTYDIPLSQPQTDVEPDLAAGERMAKIVGCWAGCHGVRGEGGVEEIPGIRRITAPPLGSVITHYTDAELVRLILHGVKRDNRSAIGMSSYTFWPLGDADIANIIHFLQS
jgi:hypothetical protein